MGCILACLRFKEDDKKKKKKAHLKSSPVPSKSKEPLLAKNQFASVFISEGSSCERVEDLNSRDDVDEYILDRDFRDEVKFLKSCGAILETPAELRKASEKLVAQLPTKDITLNSSCAAATPFKKLAWDEQQEDLGFAQNSSEGIEGHHAQRDNGSASPSAATREPVHSESGTESAMLDVSVHTESGTESAVLDVSSSQDDTQNQSDGTEDSACLGSVRLDPEVESESEDVCPSQDDARIHALGSESFRVEDIKHDGTDEEIVSAVLDVSPTQDDSQLQQVASKRSPYPTPLKLSDEMETPGTIYPASYENIRRKNARIRTQYVYPILNPVENLTQWTDLREGSEQSSQSEKVQQTPVASFPNNQKDKRSPNREEFDKENHGIVKRLRSLTPVSDSKWKVTASPDSHQLVIASLSQWLKPPPDVKRSQKEHDATKYSGPERTPDVERPIFGVVAMHWNEDDLSKFTPKWWGGNGIPNTTTKYKEDQKVSWHATPFEERLDKALSDDNLLPRRKEISRKLVGFKGEGEESDTESS